jgi:hypothetical protein
MSVEPEKGCAALGDPLGARDRAALALDSDAGTIVRDHGAWVRELPIDLSLRGGTGQATVTAIGIRPRERAGPPLSAALLCHSTSGTPPVARLTANLDVAPVGCGYSISVADLAFSVRLRRASVLVDQAAEDFLSSEPGDVEVGGSYR